MARTLLLVVLAAFPAGAAAAVPTPVEPVDVGKWRAKGPIHDTVLPPSGVRARAAADRTQEFIDDGSHVITVTTDVPGLNLLPYAQVLAYLIHYDEIEDVTVEVVAPGLISAVCGAEALGCYQPEAPGRSPRGHMWIPSVHEDLMHIIVHEYGHHMDNQLANLAGFGFGCDISGDGSRNWFFERDADDSLIDLGMSCSPQNDGSHMLGELYAEDYTWLHGNQSWRPDMPVPAPGDLHLEAMSSDMAVPFKRQSRRISWWVPRRESRMVPLKLNHWTFFSAKLTGRGAADLDLYLRKANARRALARSAGARSREHVERVLAPGRYEIEVFASAKGAHASLRLSLD
jgi:hypothetical protein